MSFKIESGVLKYYTGEDKVVTVPDGVTAVGSGAFEACSFIEEVRLPDSVAEIGRRAFEGCHFLKKINIPHGVEVIELSAFYGCVLLNELWLPDGLLEIRDEAFSGCVSLESIRLPSTIRHIASDAFAYTPIRPRVEGDFEYYGDYYLNRYTGKDTVVTVPDGVTSIGSRAFYDNTTLKEVRLPSGVVSVGQRAFDGCTALVSVHLPDGLKRIGFNAFCDCTALPYIHLPDSLTGMGMNAFSNCFSLREIRIPDKVTDVYIGVFQSCLSLSSVTLGNGVEFLDHKCFHNCRALTEVTALGCLQGIERFAFKRPVGVKSFVAPETPFEVFKWDNTRRWAIIGFLKNRSLYTDEKRVAEYTEYISTHVKELAELVLAEDMDDMVVLLAQRGYINCDNFEDDFFVPAMKAGATKCKAFLLDWKHKNLGTSSPTDELKL